MKVPSYITALTAAFTAASGAAVPRDDSQAAVSSFFIKAVALKGPSQVTGLVAQAYHSGAGQAVVAMVPPLDGNSYNLNATSKEITFKSSGGGKQVYTNILSMPNQEPFAQKLRHTYQIVAVNLFPSDHHTWQIAKDGTINPTPFPYFHGFSVCHVKSIAPDEPVASYQQLVWKSTSGPPDSSCTDVKLVTWNP